MLIILLFDMTLCYHYAVQVLVWKLVRTDIGILLITKLLLAECQ